MPTFRSIVLAALIVLLPLISLCRNKPLAPVITSFTPISGHYGDTITINGSGFLTADIYYVAFDDYQATEFWVVSDSVIKAVVDNGSSGDVSLYTYAGETSLPGFIYTGPTIFRFSPTTIVSDPLEVKIYGTYFTGVNQVLFGGFPAASFVVNSDSLITAVVGEPGYGEIVVGSPKGSAAAPGFISPLITTFEPDQGTTGDTITIHGWNFLSVEYVLLGNVAAKSFTTVSDSLIKAVVGPGESGPVTVASGFDNSVAYDFRYIPYQPHIKSFFPSGGTTGDTITIKGDHLRYTTDVSFGGTLAASFDVRSDTLVKAVIGSGSSGKIFIAFGQWSDSLGTFTFHADQPLITSVNPSSGKMGDIITIKGNGFNKKTSSNIVYFGPVKATIISGTDSTLMVTVPAGTMFGEITVTNKHLTASSPKPFSVIFPGATDKINTSSFSTPLKFLINSVKPGKWVTSDFDNDGRIDVASIYDQYYNINQLTVFRNTGIGNSVSFGPPQSWRIGQDSWDAGFDVTVVDVDGDGKQDLLYLNSFDDSVTVLKNTSSPGNISFVIVTVFSTHTPNLPQENQAHAVTLVLKDFDLDGKPDIAFAASELTPLCTYIYRKNTSTDSTISFGIANETALYDARYIYCTDLNNDRKPDLAVVNNLMGTTASKITIFRNQSGTDPNFILSSYTGSNEQDIYHTPVFGDLDGDNKADLVAADGPFGTISVFRNFSSDSNDIGFEQPLVLSLGSQTNSTALTDIDGDGKLDIIVSNTSGNNQIWVLKNRSTVGTLLFDTARIYSGPAVSNILLIADFNNDGRPDIFTTGPTGSFISIFVNKVGSIRLCPGGGTMLSSNLTGSAYQWQASIGSAGSFSNITNNSNYAGATSASLSLSNIPSSFSGYRYRCVVDGTNSEEYTIHVENTWLGTVDASWANPANWSCGVVPDGNSEVLIPSGNVVVSSNATCKSITVSPTAHLTINPGVMLTITH